MLTPFTSVTEQQTGEVRDPRKGRFQCLRCSFEFKPDEPSLGLESGEGWKPLFQDPGTSCALDLPTTGKVSLRGVCRGSPRKEGLRGVGNCWHQGDTQLPACCVKQQKRSCQSWECCFVSVLKYTHYFFIT